MSIAAPATNPASDLELKLPATIGSAGQALKNSSTPGTLEFGAAGLFSSYAIIEDQKAHDTHAGTFSQDAWRTRELNTEVTDPDGIIIGFSGKATSGNLKSNGTNYTTQPLGNRFELAAGTYLVQWSAPCRTGYHHQTRLYNIADSSVVRHGSSEYVNDVNVQTTSTGFARFTISGNKDFELQHYTNNTVASTGFGTAANSDGGLEHYAMVIIYKEV